jgi:hypothetical protein
MTMKRWEVECRPFNEAEHRIYDAIGDVINGVDARVVMRVLLVLLVDLWRERPPDGPDVDEFVDLCATTLRENAELPNDGRVGVH